MVNRIAIALREKGAVVYGDFVLASGARSTYYIDIKTALTDPGILGMIGQEISTRHKGFEAVAGVAVGGIPIAVSVSLASGKPYVIIRKEEKSHGRNGMVIGNPSGLGILLVEDVTTSGGSSLYGVRTLREAGAKVDTVVTVVDREQGAAALLGTHGITLAPLAKADELLKE
ncbi:MAG: orotate phosphoribosyltransferase [Methanoregulaceae archaeon]|nr:orotate phosphoribosyltransferase [Methanoregulaceae archaeon]